MRVPITSIYTGILHYEVGYTWGQLLNERDVVDSKRAWGQRIKSVDQTADPLAKNAGGRFPDRRRWRRQRRRPCTCTRTRLRPVKQHVGPTNTLFTSTIRRSLQQQRRRRQALDGLVVDLVEYLLHGSSAHYIEARRYDVQRQA